MGAITFSGLWRQARITLKGNWAKAIGVTLVQWLISCAAQSIPVVGNFAHIFLIPLSVGLLLYFLMLARTQKPALETIFVPFNSYGRMLWGGIRMGIFIFLQYLLLIIPGIVATYRYAMTFYIMLDEPELKVRDAMIKSREMMYNHKMQLFGYSILLALLALAVTVFTIGIGLIWFVPFTQALMANYYLQLKSAYELKHPTVIAGE